MSRRTRSTLFTSPRSAGDFVLRVFFFALAPVAIVLVAALFPVGGALFSVALALSVFLVGEAARTSASSRRWLAWLLSRELAFEAYYRSRRPRPFLYYVFYPLLFPYWLVNRDARTEFLLFKGMTLGSVALLAVSSAIQFVTSWQPDLGLRAFVPALLISFAVEWLLVLALLMPIATTVVGYHESRRGRLVALLVVGAFSTALATARLLHQRDPVVSFAARERVQLRTNAQPSAARAAQVAAVQAAWAGWRDAPGAVDGDGKVEGAPLDAAYAALERFYKHDEAYAFDLWAAPRKSPTLLVLYFPARQKRPPIWIALRRDGSEMRDAKALPAGAFRAMAHAADH